MCKCAQETVIGWLNQNLRATIQISVRKTQCSYLCVFFNLHTGRIYIKVQFRMKKVRMYFRSIYWRFFFWTNGSQLALVSKWYVVIST